MANIPPQRPGPPRRSDKINRPPNALSDNESGSVIATSNRSSLTQKRSHRQSQSNKKRLYLLVGGLVSALLLALGTIVAMLLSDGPAPKAETKESDQPVTVEKSNPKTESIRRVTVTNEQVALPTEPWKDEQDDTPKILIDDKQDHHVAPPATSDEQNLIQENQKNSSTATISDRETNLAADHEAIFSDLPEAIAIPDIGDTERPIDGFTIGPEFKLTKISSVVTPSIHINEIGDSGWEIIKVNSDKTSPLVLAKLTRSQDGSLTWLWTEFADKQTVADVANAWLYLEWNEKRHKIALRIPALVKAFVWDFKEAEIKPQYAREVSTARIAKVPADAMVTVEISIPGEEPRILKPGKKCSFTIPDAKQRKKKSIPGSVRAEYRIEQTVSDNSYIDLNVEQRFSFRVDGVSAPLTNESIKKRNVQIINIRDNANKAVNSSIVRLKAIDNAIRVAKANYNGERLKAELIELGQRQRNEFGKKKIKMRRFNKYDALFKNGLPKFKNQVIDEIKDRSVNISIFLENEGSGNEKILLSSSNLGNVD